MKAPRRSREEQYQLVLECRQSGLSDYNWCREHDINPGVARQIESGVNGILFSVPRGT